jgi:hypothetical protein
MKPGTQHENKMLGTGALALENKQEDRGIRVRTGQIDAELRVRRLEGLDFPVPLVDVRMFRQSPADVSADAFHATAAGVSLEAKFLPALLEALAKVAA